MEMFHGINDMALSSTIGAGIGFLVLAVLLYALIIYNNLVRLKVDIDKAWANVDVLLKWNKRVRLEKKKIAPLNPLGPLVSGFYHPQLPHVAMKP